MLDLRVRRGMRIEIEIPKLLDVTMSRPAVSRSGHVNLVASVSGILSGRAVKIAVYPIHCQILIRVCLLASWQI